MTDIVVSHEAERSILRDSRRDQLEPYAVGGRWRWATCSGVAWFRGHHLAVVNTYGGHLRIYRFHPQDDLGAAPARIELLHELPEGFRGPEEVAVSRDGRLMAVTHSLSDDLGVTLHRLDAGSLVPGPGDNLRRGRLGSAFHGLDFSPDSRHLAFTQIGEPSYVEVVRLGSPAGERACRLDNRDAPLKPKAVAFSFDGRFVAIAMAYNACLRDGARSIAASVRIHAFDAAQGVVEPEPAARFDDAGGRLAYPDLCTFLPSASGRYDLLVSDQALDSIVSFEFDAGRGTLAYGGVFAADLSFVHGVDASADGRFVAVTTYGDDRLHIVRVPAALTSGRSAGPTTAR